jgi:hypothetical protein
MPLARKPASASPETKQASASTVFGRPIACSMPRMLAAKLVASEGQAVRLVARISCEPSAQTTA